MNPWLHWVQLAAGIIAVAFVGGLSTIVLYKIATDKINLQHVISESDGAASMSRFQLLIFTFVIAMSFFLVVVGGGEKNPPAFPDKIPPGVLTLLGISASSYLVSKGIQASTENQPSVTVTPASTTVKAGGSQQFAASVANLPSGNVTWSVSPVGAGTISADGLFTAPGQVVQRTVEVKATSTDDGKVSGTATVTVVA
jgi:hypothetical protein